MSSLLNTSCCSVFVCISFTIHAFIAILSFFIFVISESRSKQVLHSSPQNRLHSHLSNASQSASHKSRESHSYPMQTEDTFTQLKASPHWEKAIKQQASLQSTSSAKKQTDTPKKRKRLSKEHKTEESSTDLGRSEVSVEEIMALFKPMLACISPLPDLVRIQKCFMQMLFLNYRLICRFPCIHL